MENPENPANGLAPPGRKVRELTNGEQEAIVYQLLETMEDDWQQLTLLLMACLLMTHSQ